VPGRGRGVSNLALRITTAVIGIPIVLAINYAGGRAFGVAVGAIAAVGCFEIYGLFRQAEFSPAQALGIPVAIAFAALPQLKRGTDEGWIGLLMMLVAVGGVYFLLPGSDGKRLLNWNLTVLGAVYVGLMLGHLTVLRTWSSGAWWVALVFLITWGYDTGAYVSGRLFGSRPFMSHISAKKTVEGVQGGLILSSLAGCIGVPALGITVWQGLLLGFMGGVAAQAGDLVESMIKRQVGAKDSGSIIPGHGGLLDRIDSLLFTAVLTVYAARAFGYGP
jgi:phosphatidate cytidylyltransferase